MPIFNSLNNSNERELLTFQYDASSATTFDPSLTSSKSIRWDIGDGSLPVASNSISVNPLIDGTKTAKAWVDRLQHVTAIDMNADGIIGGYDFSMMDNINIVRLQNNPSLTGVTLPETILVDFSSLFLHGCDLTGPLDLTGIDGVPNNSYIRVYDNPNLTAVTFNAVSTNGFILALDFHNTGIASIDLTKFTAVGSVLNLSDCPNLKTILLPISPSGNGLQSTKINNTGYEGVLNMSGLTKISNVLEIYGNNYSGGTGTTEIIFPTLTAIINSFRVDYNELTVLDIRNITSLAVTVNMEGNPALQYPLMPPSSSTIVNLTMRDCNIQYADLSGLSFYNDGAGGGTTNIYLEDNTMVVGGVNQILADLVTQGSTHNTVDISGTNSTPNSGVTDTITAVNTGTTTFTVATDRTAYYVKGTTFTISGSTNNNGTFTVVSSSFPASCEVIVEEVVGLVADGTITTTNGSTAKTTLLADSWTVSTTI